MTLRDRIWSMAILEEHKQTAEPQDFAGYEEAQLGAVTHRFEHPGLIRLSGSDRIDFIQRQTTNDVSRLGPEQSVTTVLTSPKARILDVLTLLEDGDSVMAVCLPGRGPATAAFFQSRIFFMDQVTVEDESTRWAQFDLDGPQAADVLPGFAMDHTPEPNEAGQFELEGTAVRVIVRHGFGGRGFRLLVPAEAAEPVAEVLYARGGTQIMAGVYDVLRVEAGLPGPAGELVGEYTPLEIGLREAISATKGCYTGQEVIARQITYDKVVRNLKGLRLEAQVATGSRVMIAGKPAGEVTSSAVSPRFGPIGLAVLRSQLVETGGKVEIEHGAGSLTAEIADLPFQANLPLNLPPQGGQP